MNQSSTKLFLQSNYSDGKILISCQEDRLEFGSRIFVDGQWHDVSIDPDGDVESYLSLNITWHAEEANGWFSLRATLTNNGLAPIRLGAFQMLEGAGLVEKTSPDDVVLVDSGGAWFSGTAKVSSACPHYLEKWEDYYQAGEDIRWAKDIQGDLTDGAHYSLSGMLAHYRSRDLPVWVFSFTTPLQRCTGIPYLLADPATGEIRRLALSNNFAGYELQPGENIETEEVILGAFSDPHAALEDWATICADKRQIQITTEPPIGWLSWYGYRLEQTEDETLRISNLIKQEFSGIPFRYMQLDLGYNKNNLPGEWFETNENFPHGLSWLKDRLKENGHELGVWICPYYVAADSTFAKEHPEALLKTHPHDPGRWTWEPQCDLRELDITHPEGEKFLRQIFRHFKAIGVTYFKLDFLGRAGRVDDTFQVHNRKIIRGVEYYRRLCQIVMEEVDKSDYVYWCSNLLYFGLDLGNTSMSCCDIGNTGFEQKGKIEGRVENSEYFKRQATTVLSRYYLHRKLVMLNADAVNIAPPADYEECRLRATLVAMSGGQVFLGDRFDLAKPDRFELIRQITPPYGCSARPVDLFERIYPDGYPSIWHLHVDSWDQRDIVALVNLDEQTILSFELEQLGLTPGRRYHLWEFWEQTYLGTTDSQLTLELPSLSCRLIAIVPERPHPWVLATSFHYTQGGMDLRDVSWDGETLSGYLNSSDGRQGDILFHVPKPYSCDLECLAPEIFRYRIKSYHTEKKWEIRFME